MPAVYDQIATKPIEICTRRSVVYISGDMTLRTSPEVSAAVLDALETGSQPRLILDLSGVAHIDSSGLATLVEALREANKHRVRLILSGLNHSLRRILDRMRLSHMFEIAPTVQEALA